MTNGNTAITIRDAVPEDAPAIEFQCSVVKRPEFLVAAVFQPQSGSRRYDLVSRRGWHKNLHADKVCGASLVSIFFDTFSAGAHRHAFLFGTNIITVSRLRNDVSR